jgi:hypothetical protein
MTVFARLLESTVADVLDEASRRICVPLTAVSGAVGLGKFAV